MKIGLKGILVISLGLALLQPAFGADTKPASKDVKPPAAGEKPKSNFKDEKEKESYSVGMNIGNSMKRGGVDLDLDMIMAAIKDVLAGRELKLTDQEAQEALAAYSKEARAKQEENSKKMAE